MWKFATKEQPKMWNFACSTIISYDIMGSARMKRKIYKDLLNWKLNRSKKPLMVIGARQVGKTFIIEEFIRNEFSEFLSFNLYDRPDIFNIFSGKQ